MHYILRRRISSKYLSRCPIELFTIVCLRTTTNSFVVRGILFNGRDENRLSELWRENLDKSFVAHARRVRSTRNFSFVRVASRDDDDDHDVIYFNFSDSESCRATGRCKSRARPTQLIVRPISLLLLLLLLLVRAVHVYFIAVHDRIPRRTIRIRQKQRKPTGGENRVREPSSLALKEL